MIRDPPGWQSNEKSGAMAFFAVHGDVALMQLNNFRGDG
jgi:hypothetical protein